MELDIVILAVQFAILKECFNNTKIMSRSRRYPIFTDIGRHRIFAKRESNKKLRKFLKTISIGFKSSIIKKKLYNPWNICDYKFKPRSHEQWLKAGRK